MRGARHISPAAAAALVALAVAACGGGSDAVVVRVGATPIAKTTVDHRVAVMAGGQAPNPDSHRYQTLRQRALEFLISAEWLLGEATAQGVRVTSQEVSKWLHEREQRSFPGAEAEYRAYLKATGQTAADGYLEAAAELASAKLRAVATSSAHPVTHAQVVAYYDAHRLRFAVPELREVSFTNRKSAAEADQLVRQIKPGERSAGLSLGLTLARRGVDAMATLPLNAAVFAAKPHVLTGPVKQGADYFVFELTRILPEVPPTLAQVQGSIESKLADEARRRALAGFAAAWRATWTAKTDCRPGYVVAKCRQYTGPVHAEDPFSLN